MTRMARLTEDAPRGAVRFMTGDACSLPANMAPVDAILAANLICRLPDPTQFLNALPRLVKPGGVVVLTTPWSWLQAWTPKGNWLGGCAQPCHGCLPSWLSRCLCSLGGHWVVPVQSLRVSMPVWLAALCLLLQSPCRCLTQDRCGCRYMFEGKPIRSFDRLKEVMTQNGFELKTTEELPFVIREHARKFQWGCAQGSVWIKKP